MIAEYIEAFQRCYPGRSVELKPKLDNRTREMRWRVIIDKDPGDILLTEAEVKSATRDFNRGMKR
jgi:hypothetical protein